MKDVTMKKLSLVCLIAAACTPALTLAHSAGDVLFRAGAATAVPKKHGSNDVSTFGKFNINDNTQLGLTGTYMVTDNIGVELLAATPFSHRVGLAGTNIAKVKHLPPTLMAQYYFGDAKSAWRPYMGVGVNYTTFFDEKFTNDLNGALTDLELKDSWGIAGQAGMDYAIGDNLIVNASVWWIDIDTKVKFKLAGEQQSIKTNLDPWVFMMGAGYRF
jgi:outer membrane protein